MSGTVVRASRRWQAPLAVAAAGATAVGVLVVRDPHGSEAWGTCPSLLLTGQWCPLCGSLRGVHDLATGQVAEAVGHNLLLLPVLVWLGWWWVAALAAPAAGRTLPGPPTSAAFGWFVGALLVAFTVARNLPGSPLAP